MKIEEFGMSYKYIAGMVAGTGAALCEVDYYIYTGCSHVHWLIIYTLHKVSCKN